MHKFYGQFTPSVDQFIFERYFRDTNIKGVFVECGAFDGLTECSCKFFEESMGWKGFNLEPAPANFKQLQKNRPSSVNLEIGLSNCSGEVDFKHVVSPLLGENFGNGSITHSLDHIHDLQQRGCSFQNVQIQVTTWKCFVEQQNICHVDLLVLDVEGHELSVIEGMRDCAVLPDLICIEVGHLDLGEIRNGLATLGYTYDISSHVNAFFLKTEKIPLFALRAATSSAPVPESGNQSRLVEKLVEENQRLTKRVEELTWLYREITSSKLWKVVEKIRSWRR
ncbi:FkbM family methyltransferase [Laribacter hongkongensis]|uniref:FkbM family methyltransferase n=1 Tax=Laribacter hongkongensis TaxID=168471 RepID=UPI001EFE52A3|nr:FkbM family methyltransferase [Laribacter hongkongensis]MCG9082787.1 FkbM family methyltransferase [Laribacter hongkongensis]